MSAPIVYLDLDRTLFRTDQMGELWKQLERMYPDVVDAAREHERRDQFYRWSDDMYCHDAGAQLRTLGLDPVRVYSELVRLPLGDGRFEYEGCHSLIDYLKRVARPVILTYGADDYQRFKASLCPSLQGVPVETTLEPKPQWLHQRAASGWLIDDKPIGENLPDRVTFVQVCHGRAHTDATWPVCGSLGEVEAYFRQVLPNAE